MARYVTFTQELFHKNDMPNALPRCVPVTKDKVHIVDTTMFFAKESGGVETALSMLLHPYLTAPIIAATLLGWRFITLYWSMLVGAPVFIWLVRQRSTHPCVANWEGRY